MISLHTGIHLLMDIKEIVGHNIRKTRNSLGWSQEELAERSGTHRTYVSGVERGKRNPTIKILSIFAQALSVDIAELLSNTND